MNVDQIPYILWCNGIVARICYKLIHASVLKHLNISLDNTERPKPQIHACTRIVTY